MNRICQSQTHSGQQGSILVGLLWCMALLAVVVIGVLHTSRLDLMLVKNYGDRIQAHYLALAGVEKAKALLFAEAIERRRAAKNHSGDLYDAPDVFKDVPMGRGSYRVFHRAHQNGDNSLLYGISDEESLLNINQAGPEELAKLYGFTPDIVAAITDWKDEDNNVSPAGAEAEYYTSLRPPYLPRNGPFQSVRELLLVRGVSRELLLGDDMDQNGLLDQEPGSRPGSRVRTGTGLDSGLWNLLTVNGWVGNTDAAGEKRVNIQTADENSLKGVTGITAEIAKAIIAYRGQNRLESIADLLDVTANQNQAAGRQPANAPANQGAQASSGPRVVSEDLLLEIADKLSSETVEELPGVININTASASILACLPGLSPDLAQAIVSYRTSNGFFPNIAHLLRVPGFNRDLFKQVARRVTARSETFRIISEGKVNSSGARQRLEVIVHLGADDVKTLSYREDL